MGYLCMMLLARVAWLVMGGVGEAVAGAPDFPSSTFTYWRPFWATRMGTAAGAGSSLVDGTHSLPSSSY